MSREITEELAELKKELGDKTELVILKQLKEIKDLLGLVKGSGEGKIQIEAGEFKQSVDLSPLEKWYSVLDKRFKSLELLLTAFANRDEVTIKNVKDLQPKVNVASPKVEVNVDNKEVAKRIAEISKLLQGGMPTSGRVIEYDKNNLPIKSEMVVEGKTYLINITRSQTGLLKSFNISAR